MRTIGNIRVGKPDTTPSKSSHTQGVRQGNEPGSFERTPGLYTTGGKAGGRRPMGKGTARRSTGINPEARNPIDPNSPNLSPA